MCPKLMCRWCGQTWQSTTQAGYHHNIQCLKMPLRQKGTRLLNYSPDVVIPRPGQRSIPSNPFQSVPRQPIPRTRPNRVYPTSLPGTSRPQMGRDLPVSAQLSNKNYYQTTHVVYDLQGIPTYQDRPIKMQRLADDYQVSHVGYDLSGDPIYMNNGSEI